MSSNPNALMIGTGEYTTGYVHGQASVSDKSAGVGALSLFDMRCRGLIDRVAMVGTNGPKFAGIRDHFRRKIADVYGDIDIDFDSFPGDDVAADPAAYLAALDSMAPGDLVTIFTPDDTHCDIALAAIDRGLHVLATKPPVKTLEEHRTLLEAARSKDVLVAVEVHTRWDPIYAAARDRIRKLGDFSFFASYMSQPKAQLETFRHWAGKSSDISYYLNSHHVDFHSWAVQGIARPSQVTATASTGVAQSAPFDVQTEDTITLAAQWENIENGNHGTAVYTASWIAPRSDVHSQQRFFYMGHDGEITVDQAHRGYGVATDNDGYASATPRFMKYTPDAQGHFAGQSGYGYRSFEAVVQAGHAIRGGERRPGDFSGTLATIEETATMTAILEAGRRSLDTGGQPHRINFDGVGNPQEVKEA